MGSSHSSDTASLQGFLKIAQERFI